MRFERAASGLAFPESPRWSERDGCWYFVEWQGDRVARLTDGRPETVINTGPGSGPSGLAQAPDGSFWVCLYSARRLVHFDSGGRQLSSWDSFRGQPFRGPNDLTLDASGRVVFTDGGDFEEDWRSGRPAGGLYSLDRAGQLEKLDEGLCFPNGIGISTDGRSLYVSEHRKNRLLRYQLATGMRSVLHEFSEPVLLNREAAFEAGPDGMFLDRIGRLWVALYGCGSILVLNSSGNIERRIRLPNGRRPTSVGLRGVDELMVSEAESNSLYQMTLKD